jgi:glycosyltransferase involved in cell wall biosynthesis
VECLPNRYRCRLANRRLEGVRSRNLRTRPLLEWRAIRRLEAGEEEQTVMFERNAAFQSVIPRRELESSDVVVGFDTSSWVLAERTLALKRPFILDQSIGHPSSYQSLLPALCERFPQWAQDCEPRRPQVIQAESSEHRLASKIVVASSFTRRTLIENGVPSGKIITNPYGVDLGRFSPLWRPAPSRPLRFLFLGTLSVRKGVPLLLDTWRGLSPRDAELWLAGPLTRQHAALIPSLPGLRVIGKTPHRELPRLLRECDVLVFPSYFEGFGLVLLEAMAAGLPVIATDATAAPDLITNGVEGLIIPAGSAEALSEAVQFFLRFPENLFPMSAAARRCAERYSWDAYGNRWANLLSHVARC